MAKPKTPGGKKKHFANKKGNKGGKGNHHQKPSAPKAVHQDVKDNKKQLPPKASGDDLDDYVIAPVLADNDETSSVSDYEGEEVQPQKEVKSGDDQTNKKQGKNDKKRKREEKDIVEEEEKEQRKKEKTKERLKQLKVKQKENNQAKRVKLELLPKAEQAQCLSQYYKEIFPSDSLDQQTVQESYLLRLSEGTQHSDEKWVDELKSLAGEDWKKYLAQPEKKDGPKGAPSVIILCASAVRACDLIRYLGAFNKQCKIAKLFSKHIKVEEQVEALKGHQCCLAVGTPNRVQKLAQMGALNLDNCKYMVLDMHRDVKDLCLLDIKDTRKDFITLYRTFCYNQVSDGKTKICVI